LGQGQIGPADAAALQQEAQNVHLVGQIGGHTDAAAVRGDRAFVGVGLRLFILDVRNPARHTVVGQT
jgi:hypothetical protein